MDESIAAYCRVSTEDQSLERQLQSTSEYATSVLDADLGDVHTYRDKSTGTDTDRSGYRDLMEDVEAGEFEAVVVHSVSRISRSIQDLDATVDRITDSGTELRIIKESFEFLPDEEDPYQTAMFQLLGVFAELEASMAQQRTREGLQARITGEEEYVHGPAPLGYAKDDGRLYEADNHQEVCIVLEMVQNDNLSKRKAASRLDTSRATIRRTLDDRAELYGLAQ
jgi:DNA invertase Pin-like site-specific DNA recombinase